MMRWTNWSPEAAAQTAESYNQDVRIDALKMALNTAADKLEEASKYPSLISVSMGYRLRQAAADARRAAQR